MSHNELNRTELPKLEARPGSWGRRDLYLNDSILLVRYAAGDCDSINWPFGERDAENLRSALFDAYEVGELETRTVLLPDGSKFAIDGE